MVVTESDRRVSAVRCSIAGSFKRQSQSRTSRPRNMFWTTSRLSHSARSWYTTSIPSLDASFGLLTWTGFPSKMISPLSGAWMPATVLTRVDLPAPLSPTSAMTSPARTSKSTSASACTDPNDFVIPRSSRVGVSVTVSHFLPQWSGGGAQEAPPPTVTALSFGLLAELRELADADVGLLEELVLEEPRVIRLRDRDDRNLDGRLLLAAVLAEPVDPGHLLVLEQRDGRGSSSVGLVGHVLVDGHRLPARDDVLHALHGRVLSRKGDRLQLLRLQGSDHGARDAVVRSDGAVDLVARLQQHLLEDRLRVRRQPERHELLRALGQLAAREQRIQDRVVPALEPERVLIGRAAPELGDNGLRLALEGV